MSSDVKIPEWAMTSGRAFAEQWAISKAEEECALDHARALLAAEQKGRKAGLVDAAALAAKFVGDRLYKPKMPVCSYHASELSAAIISLGNDD